MDTVLFGVLPYIVLAVALAGALRRFTRQRETVTSASSQFLEGRIQYWGAVSWHYAIITVLAGHLLAIFAPRLVTRLLASPTRLLVVECVLLAAGVLALLGMVILAVRRLSLRGRSTVLDWVVLGVLLTQVATGVWIAATMRWGLAWFVHVASPWLASVARLAPRVDLMAPLPSAVKLHALEGLVILALVPYTRLAHIFVAPFGYLWRRPQVVVWLRSHPSRNQVSR